MGNSFARRIFWKDDESSPYSSTCDDTFTYDSPINEVAVPTPPLSCSSPPSPPRINCASPVSDVATTGDADNKSHSRIQEPSRSPLLYLVEASHHLPYYYHLSH
jgi:hypothetical protein